MTNNFEEREYWLLSLKMKYGPQKNFRFFGTESEASTALNNIIFKRTREEERRDICSTGIEKEIKSKKSYKTDHEPGENYEEPF